VWVRYRRPYRVTTNSAHSQPVFSNRLQRDFQVAAPDRVWASDISYVWTAEGWLYLAVVIDLYVHKVVGWSLGKRLTSALACDVLRMALWRRQPPRGQLLHHSERRAVCQPTVPWPATGVWHDRQHESQRPLLR
jgi:putative transposase